MSVQKDDKPGSESGPLGCPGCGYDLAGLLPDEKAVAKCPECGRRVITLKEVTKLQQQRRKFRSRAKWWTGIGLSQGPIAAICLEAYRTQIGNPSPTYHIIEYGLFFGVPITFLIAGICGGVRGRYRTPDAGAWDIFFGAFCFMFCWLSVCLITLFAISFLRFHVL